MNTSKTIVSLAVLKVNWDSKKTDYIDNFVPFLVHLIYKKGYKIIDAKIMEKDFQEEYGLILPFYPILTILNRAKKKGYIKKDGVNFIPETNKIIEDDFSKVSEEQERKLNQVVNKFIEFCKKDYSVAFTKEKAESIFLSFLKRDNLDVVFGNQNDLILPEVEEIKSGYYFVGKFIIESKKSEHSIFGFILDIGIGQILAHTILQGSMSSYCCDFKNINYYLDVGFIFDLLNINGEE